MFYRSKASTDFRYVYITRKLQCVLFHRLKLTGSKESDDRIYNTFREKFPKLDVVKFKEDDLKSETAKAEWREFSEGRKPLLLLMVGLSINKEI